MLQNMKIILIILMCFGGQFDNYSQQIAFIFA